MRKILDASGWALLFAMPILILIGSCNQSKKISRQDTAAVERVTAKRPLLDAVGAKWRDLNPCASDTTYVTKEGQVITRENWDTLYLQGTNDTVIRTVTKTVFKDRVDTLVKVVVNNNDRDSALAQLHRVELKVKDAESANVATAAKADDFRHERNNWRLYFILLGIAFGGLAFLYVKGQFFKI